MRRRIGLPPEIWSIFWGLFFIEGTYGAYQSVWPLWIERLGAPLFVVGLVIGSGGFVRLLFLAPSAAIGHRFGYRRAMVVCRLCVAFGLFAAALATHWTQLLVMVLGGAIGDLVFPLAQSLVAALAADQRVRSFALVFTVGPAVAMTISPLVSGGLVALFGMRAAFAFAGCCTLLAVYFLNRAHEPAGFAASKGAAAPADSSYGAVFAVPSVRLLAALLFATVFSLSLGTSFVSNYLEDVRGLEPSLIAVLSAGAAVGTATLGLAVTRVRRLQHAPFVVIALAIGVCAAAFGLFRSSGFAPLIGLAFFCRGGFFTAWAMHNAALGELTPAVHRSRAFALLEMVGGVAFALGPMVAGVLYGIRHTLAFDAAIALSLVLVPLMLAANRRTRAMHAAMPHAAEPSLAA